MRIVLVAALALAGCAAPVANYDREPLLESCPVPYAVDPEAPLAANNDGLNPGGCLRLMSVLLVRAP